MVKIILEPQHEYDDHVIPKSMLKRNEPQHEISNNVVCATSNGSDQPAHTRSLIGASASRMNIL